MNSTIHFIQLLCHFVHPDFRKHPNISYIAYEKSTI
jgi:hypothetical protein